ncbi:A24 family peptidase [Amycolatopsis sp. NBRC 101858]|uniref:prepilin peptidase n=1 Tax=Amycolatopsis sp. NBRC 101858 TaxID=3032200 RepID=UPI002557B555|nr:A24 family peptidase [Amycolatopsis sp. NBRC 101858]
MAPIAVGLLRLNAKRVLSRWCVVVTLVAVLAAGVVVALWSTAVVVGAAFVLLGVPTAVIDVNEHRIPDRLSLPLCGLAGAAALSTVVAGNFESGVRALIGGGAWAGLMLLSYLATGQPGPGDVKLAPSVGLLLGWFGWSWALAGVLAVYLLTAVAGIAAVWFGRCSFHGGQVPMAPSMVVVALVGGTLAQL